MLRYILILWLAVFPFAGIATLFAETDFKDATIIPASQIEIVSTAGEEAPPSGKLVAGFAKFDEANAVPGFLLLEKNREGSDGMLEPHRIPAALLVPTESLDVGNYAVWFRLLTWGASEECTPISAIDIQEGKTPDQVQLEIPQQEMMVLRKGSYRGEGKWKWVKVIPSLSFSKKPSIKLEVLLVGGSGRYTGILISEVAVEKIAAP